MNEQDKAAWLQACNEWHANSGGKDLGEFMFQAALEYARRKQEPMATRFRYLRSEDGRPITDWNCVPVWPMRECSFMETQPLYTLPPAPVRLTDEEIWQALFQAESDRGCLDINGSTTLGIAHAVMNALERKRGEV